MVIATSLKMYFDHEETVRWASEVRDIARRSQQVQAGNVNLLVFPSFPSISTLVDLFSDTQVSVGAQDVAACDRGAYTGEVNVHTLKQVGCTHIEIGHAERRKYFGETMETMQNKVSLTLENNLVPLICVGENEKVEPAQAAAICIDFIKEVTQRVPSNNQIAPIFAYEPEWAIGADQPAATEYVRSVTSTIRAWLRDRPGLANSKVIYGGGAGPGLLDALGETVNGLFLGRFAHDPAALEQILSELDLHVETSTPGVSAANSVRKKE